MVRKEFDDLPADCFLPIKIQSKLGTQDFAIEIATNKVSLSEEARGIKRFEPFSYKIIVDRHTFEIRALMMVFKSLSEARIDALQRRGWRCERHPDKVVFVLENEMIAGWLLDLEGTGRADVFIEIE
jgi:hypothetical protein